MMMSAVCVHVSAAEADRAESGALNNYLFGYMSWGVKHMGLDVLQEKLENSGRELPEVLVAVIDSGINTSNILLKGRYTDGYNFINNTTDFEDEEFHGTMVGGIIADGTSSNVRILPLKVNGKNGRGNMKNVAKAVDYAVKCSADVINLSLSSEDPNHSITILDREIENAVANGVVVTVASGNQSGDAADRYPANKSNVLTVTSIDRNHAIGENANTGACVDFALPGVKIFAPYKTYAMVDTGTSLAAPHAAAAAALLKTWDKSLNQAEIYEIFKQHSVDLGEKGFDTTYGWGMIDLSDFDINSVYVRPTEPPTEAPTETTTEAPTEASEALYTLGDADGDGGVSAPDVTLIQRLLAQIVSENTVNEKAADVDLDAEVTVFDVSQIQRYLAGIEIYAEVGKPIFE